MFMLALCTGQRTQSKDFDTKMALLAHFSKHNHQNIQYSISYRKNYLRDDNILVHTPIVLYFRRKLWTGLAVCLYLREFLKSDQCNIFLTQYRELIGALEIGNVISVPFARAPWRKSLVSQEIWINHSIQHSNSLKSLYSSQKALVDSFLYAWLLLF